MKILDKRVVYDGAGAPVHLTELLKAGGEGEIFLIEGTPEYCAKIFYENRCTATLFQKIMAMVAHPPGAGLINRRERHGSVVLAWPGSVLFDSPLGSRNFVGYTMPLVDTDLFREAHCYYDPQDRIRQFGGAFSWRYLLTAAYNIAAVTDDIHRHGHCIADFSGRNILIARTAAVAVIDCDSFQIRDGISGRIFPSSVGTGEYLPPELQGYNFVEKRVDRYYGDLFGLAVMVFKLLMGGVHPFQAGGEGVSALPGIEQKIQNGVFAFAAPDQHIYPPSFAPDYRIIPPSLRRLFFRCFADGIAEPKRRPSAGEWKDCLLSEIMAMKHCRANLNHWFGGHLSACPWCSRGAQDIFPAEIPFPTRDEPVQADTLPPAEERVPSSLPVPPSSSAFPPVLEDEVSGMVESVVEESFVSGCVMPMSEMPESGMPESGVHEGEGPDSDVSKSGVYECEGPDSEIPVSAVPEFDVHEHDEHDEHDSGVSESAGSESGEVIMDTPDSTPGILLPEPHLTMHNLARGITIPCRLPVTVTGNGPLLIHVTSDAPWIEIATTTVPVEGEGGVHVTLNTGNMNSKGFQKGRVMLSAGEIKEEIFLFLSVMPEF
ncbi:hypothetical protein L1S32_05610 [Methanogenium sp. S4BF]|uniref:hypothetical protein n=1 Tax=Methanogenium sp. S4BF TaxID=1789226 RepID=UPI0024172BCB|nr:hypothetical protein [Methanogenium sp. S4BF]WFN35577.1 hypothetical protein L1S32_05610 [Methanogenium sp. S4BF]